jgi:AcrR family transcriptional regulator
VRDAGLRAVTTRISAGGRKVSHAAAFSHVGSHQELLTYVAERWWAKLVDALKRASAKVDPAARLLALGLAYQRFAVKHPNHFRLMYDEGIWLAVNELEASAEPAGPVKLGNDTTYLHPEILAKVGSVRTDAFEFFEKAVLDGIADGSLRKDVKPPRVKGVTAPYMMARAVASLAHGLAMEALDEHLDEKEVAPLLSLAVDGLRNR